MPTLFTFQSNQAHIHQLQKQIASEVPPFAVPILMLVSMICFSGVGVWGRGRRLWGAPLD